MKITVKSHKRAGRVVKSHARKSSKSSKVPSMKEWLTDNPGSSRKDAPTPVTIQDTKMFLKKKKEAKIKDFSAAEYKKMNKISAKADAWRKAKYTTTSTGSRKRVKSK